MVNDWFRVSNRYCLVTWYGITLDYSCAKLVLLIGIKKVREYLSLLLVPLIEAPELPITVERATMQKASRKYANNSGRYSRIDRG